MRGGRVVFLIALLLAWPALAQTKGVLAPSNPAYVIPGTTSQADTRAADDDKDPLKNPIFRALSTGMQNQLMAEAQAYNSQCRGRIVYAAMHNCDCLSVHYLNERLRHPDASESALIQIIVADCIDQPSIAGYAYGRCVTIYSSAYPDIIKPLCECYARRYARDFARAPNDNSDAMTALGVRTIEGCKVYLQSFAPDMSTPPR